MNPGETPWLTAKLLPILDLAHGDFHSLGLGELQITTRLIKTEGDRATHHRDLDHATGHFGHVFLFHRIIRCAKIDRLINKGFTTRPRADGLIIDLWTTRFSKRRKPALVNHRGECRTRTVQSLSGCAWKSKTDSENR